LQLVAADKDPDGISLDMTCRRMDPAERYTRPRVSVVLPYKPGILSIARLKPGAGERNFG
jgi:hypothetical protein